MKKITTIRFVKVLEFSLKKLQKLVLFLLKFKHPKKYDRCKFFHRKNPNTQINPIVVKFFGEKNSNTLIKLIVVNFSQFLKKMQSVFLYLDSPDMSRSKNLKSFSLDLTL